MKNFACPYCGREKYANSSKQKGLFRDWIAVSRHTSRCTISDGSYVINEFYGPIHYTIFLKFITKNQLLEQYPLLEPKYPKPHNKYYDWYIRELDLYIELDGGLRPQVIAEKITINTQLGRELQVFKIKDIYDSNYIKEHLKDYEQ